MSNKNKFVMSEMNQVIFRQAADKAAGARFMSLFPGKFSYLVCTYRILIKSLHEPGLGYAAGYKIAQRVYKFGGQPYFRDVIDRSSAKPYFTDAFGAKWGKMIIHATAGSLTGMGEVVSLDRRCLSC
jgi:hypothetical protein